MWSEFSDIIASLSDEEGLLLKKIGILFGVSAHLTPVVPLVAPFLSVAQGDVHYLPYTKDSPVPVSIEYRHWTWQQDYFFVITAS